MFKNILAALLLVFSSMLVAAADAPLPKELEQEIRVKCQNGCAVLSAEELEQLQRAVQQIANEAFLKGKGSCRIAGKDA